MAQRNQANVSAPQAQAMTAEQSTSAILVLIGKVSKGYDNAQNLAQEAGLAVLVHAKTFGDCSKAPLLARAIPARERNSFLGWLGIYSPIRVRMGRPTRAGKVSEDKVYMAKSTEQPSSKNRWGYRPFDIEAATDNPWYNDPAGANPIPKPLDTLGDFAGSIRNRLTNAAEAAKKGERFIPTQKDNVVSFADYMLSAMDAYEKAHTVDVIDGKDVTSRQPRTAASA